MHSGDVVATGIREAEGHAWQVLLLTPASSDSGQGPFDFGLTAADSVADVIHDLTAVRNGQKVVVDVAQQCLRRINDGSDGYPTLIRVPVYRVAEVVADPTRSLGAPVFERSGARMRDVLQLFWAGETLEELSDEFGVPESHLEDVVRVTSRRAA